MRYLMLCAALALSFPVLAQPTDPVPAVEQPASELVLPANDASTVVDTLPDPIKPGEEIKTVGASVSELRELASAGQWGPFASGVIALILMLFSTAMVRFKVFRAWLKPHQGEIAIILPALGCLAYEFAQIAPGSGAVPWIGALKAGAYAGAASVGCYEVVWKRWLRPLLLKLWGLIKRKKTEDPK